MGCNIVHAKSLLEVLHHEFGVAFFFFGVVAAAWQSRGFRCAPSRAFGRL